MFKKILTVSAFVPVATVLSLASVFAQTTNTSAKPSVDIVCVQTAIDNRDIAILGAADAYTTAWKSALETRRTALKDAWNNTDKNLRRSAIQTVWNQFKQSMTNTKTDFKNTRTATWQKFYSDRKTCNPNAAFDDRTTSGVDK